MSFPQLFLFLPLVSLIHLHSLHLNLPILIHLNLLLLIRLILLTIHFIPLKITAHHQFHLPHHLHHFTLKYLQPTPEYLHLNRHFDS